MRLIFRHRGGCVCATEVSEGETWEGENARKHTCLSYENLIRKPGASLAIAALSISCEWFGIKNGLEGNAEKLTANNEWGKRP